LYRLYVPTRDWSVERVASLGQALDGFAELPKRFGIMGVAEIQIVRGSNGDRAGTGEITRGFGHCEFAAFVRIEIDVCGVAINGEGEEFVMRDARCVITVRKRIFLDADYGGIGAGETRVPSRTMWSY